jgi:hypothetical protein
MYLNNFIAQIPYFGNIVLLHKVLVGQHEFVEEATAGTVEQWRAICEKNVRLGRVRRRRSGEGREGAGRVSSNGGPSARRTSVLEGVRRRRSGEGKEGREEGGKARVRGRASAEKEQEGERVKRRNVKARETRKDGKRGKDRKSGGREDRGHTVPC